MSTITLSISDHAMQSRIYDLLIQDHQVIQAETKAKSDLYIFDLESTQNELHLQLFRNTAQTLFICSTQQFNSEWSIRSSDFLFESNTGQELVIRIHRLLNRKSQCNYSLNQSWLSIQEDSYSYGKIIIDLSGHIVSVNRTFADLHDYQVDELKGQPISILHTDSQLSLTSKALDHLKTDGGFFFERIGHRRKDGSEFQMLMNADLVTDSVTGHQYILKTGIDLSTTALPNATNQLQLLQKVIQGLSQSTDISTFILFLLKEICNATGWSYGEAWTVNPATQRLESHPAWYCGGDDDAIQEFRNRSSRISFEKGEGMIGKAWQIGEPQWIANLSDHTLFKRSALVEELGFQSAVAIPIISNQEAPMVLSFILKTNQDANSELVDLISMVASPLRILLSLQQTKLELKEMNDSLQEQVAKRTTKLTELNQELESFSYSVSHDLRAPLRAIDGFSAILAQESFDGLSDKGKRYLQIIRNSTRQMGQLIEDLLSFAHMNRRDMVQTTVNTKEMMIHIVESLQGEYLDCNHQVAIADLPMMYGDPPMIKQVFVNLLSNAFKYTSKQELAKIEIGSQEAELETIVYVKDNGVGFDMKYADKLFGVFQRLHSTQDYDGTGVGLSLVKRIMLRHGGRVWADSKPSEGSIFFIALPKRRGDSES